MCSFLNPPSFCNIQYFLSKAFLHEGYARSKRKALILDLSMLKESCRFQTLHIRITKKWSWKHLISFNRTRKSKLEDFLLSEKYFTSYNHIQLNNVQASLFLVAKLLYKYECRPPVCMSTMFLENLIISAAY